MGWALGGLVPVAKAAAEEIGQKFNVKDIGGLASSGHIANSDHYTGHAIDLMVYGDKSKGDMIAQYTFANWLRLGIKYVIWYRTYYPSPGKGEAYHGTSPHTDHVHISFLDKAGGGAPVDTAESSGESDEREGCLTILKQIVGLT
jgi:hypothetical protein